jgi:hypothetical protein
MSNNDAIPEPPSLADALKVRHGDLSPRSVVVPSPTSENTSLPPSAPNLGAAIDRYRKTRGQ